MTIYTSEKVVPYVYMGIHKETGEFYIGSRTGSRQKLPSHQDIYKYRTSSKRVKPIFDEFDWTIIAEFFDPVSAYDFEQYLIYEHWSVPGRLNNNCYYGKRRWCTSQTPFSDERRKQLSDDALKRLSDPQYRTEFLTRLSVGRENAPVREISDETRLKISTALKGKHVGRKHTPEARAKISAALACRPCSAETRAKLSKANEGKRPSDECRAKAISANTGRQQSDATKQKRSKALTGRVRSDEERAAISAGKKGKPGKIWTEESKAKMLETRRRNKLNDQSSL